LIVRVFEMVEASLRPAIGGVSNGSARNSDGIQG